MTATEKVELCAGSATVLVECPTRYTGTPAGSRETHAVLIEGEWIEGEWDGDGRHLTSVRLPEGHRFREPVRMIAALRSECETVGEGQYIAGVEDQVERARSQARELRTRILTDPDCRVLVAAMHQSARNLLSLGTAATRVVQS